MTEYQSQWDQFFKTFPKQLTLKFSCRSKPCSGSNGVKPLGVINCWHQQFFLKKKTWLRMWQCSLCGTFVWQWDLLTVHTNHKIHKFVPTVDRRFQATHVDPVDPVYIGVPSLDPGLSSKGAWWLLAVNPTFFGPLNALQKVSPVLEASTQHNKLASAEE